MRKIQNLLLSTAVGFVVGTAGLSVGSPGAYAQLDEIVITARKREESLKDVPVAVTAFTRTQLEANGVNSLEDIGQLTPQLLIGNSALQSNGSIALRGVSTGADNASSDQAVSINVDGVQVSKSNILRLAQQDLAQVEILKGPQALFFGKNSPGGIIVLKTEDPTDEFFVQGRIGYEFDAEEIFGRAIVSGPITDTLGGRFVFFGSGMDGFFTNNTPGVSDTTVPDQREIGGRVTLDFEPSDRFDANLKIALSDMEATGPAASAFQRVNCQAITGLTFSVVDGQECIADDRVNSGDPGAAAAGLDPNFRDGIPYFELDSQFVAFNWNYNLTDALTLTGITGFYQFHQELFDNFAVSIAPILFAGSAIDSRQVSQEIRLTSDFDGRINFMIGGNYEDTRYKERVPVNFFLGTGVPTYRVDGEAFSIFGQVQIDITEQLELSAGARYTHETKDASGDVSGVLPIPFAPNSIDFDNTSPEVTLSWKPTEDLLLYGGYREGFKSGGFNTTGTIFAEVLGGLTDVSFAEETVSGGEIGAKATFLEGTLDVNLAAYRFTYEDLQLTTFVPGAALSQIVANAGKARVQGVELDLIYQAPFVDGLTLNGAVAYNRARYREFTTPCFPTQTLAQGCVAGFQNLAGEPLVNAPNWSANIGFNYEGSLHDDWSIGLSTNANFTDSYQTILSANPAGLQESFWLVNSSVRFFNPEKGVELSFIGRNLSEEYIVQSTIQDALGSPEVFGGVSRGRELILQLTFSPTDFFRN